MTTTQTQRRDPAVPEAVAWLLGEGEGRCGCGGQCGQTHQDGRCDAGELGCLSVAPADRSIPDEQATTVPSEELLVWCRPCRDDAEAIARHARRERVLAELDTAEQPPREGEAAPAADRQPLNWWLHGVLQDFYAAREQWEADCESASRGYATEAAEFEERHPRPRLSDFLHDHAYRRQAAAMAVDAEDAVSTGDVEPTAADAGSGRSTERSAVDQALRAVDALKQRRHAETQRSHEADSGWPERSRGGNTDQQAAHATAGLGW